MLGAARTLADDIRGIEINAKVGRQVSSTLGMARERHDAANWETS